MRTILGMSAFFISVMFAAGAAAFCWTYLAHKVGSPSSNSVTVGAGVVGLIAFLVVYVTLKYVLNFS